MLARLTPESVVTIVALRLALHAGPVRLADALGPPAARAVVDRDVM